MATPVPAAVDIRAEDLCNNRYYNRNFSALDLSRLKLRNSLFYQCNFDNANMSETDCTESEFYGSSFRDTNCYRTNFTNAKLADTIFAPKDCTQMTITLSCATFENMKIAQIWFLGLLTLASSTKPFGPMKEDLIGPLIATIGEERYVKLRGLFSKRPR